MFAHFRTHYPKGSLISELVAVEHGKYVVRAIAQVAGEILATSLAAAETVEQAEDKARARLLAVLELPSSTQSLAQPSRTIPTPVPVAAVIPEIPSPPSLDRVEKTEAISIPSSEPEPEPAVISQTLPEPETPAVATAVKPAIENPPAPPPEVQPSGPATATLVTPIDFSEIIAKTNLEIKRLQWTQEQGKQYLLATYGKRSRQLLTDGELLEFLEYLQQQPTP